MAKHTNHTAGARGINLKGGTTLWVEPGQTVEVDKADIVGALPDFGKASDAAATAANADELAAAQARIVELEAQVADQAGQIDALTKPAK